VDTEDSSPYATAGAGSGEIARFDASRDRYEVSRDDPPPPASPAVSRRFGATRRYSVTLYRALPPAPPKSLPPPRQLREQHAQQDEIRRHRTWPQRVGGVLIACICVVCAAWYVPRVVRDDQRLLTGTVIHTGVIMLNFADSGEIQKINVRIGQAVRKGQTLATEYAPNNDALVAAGTAAIASDEAKIAQLRAAEAADPTAATVDAAQLSAARAQLAYDQAQLANDHAKVASAEIIAPSSGTVAAANGQPGEIATSSGIRDYVTDSPEPPAVQRPAFSLFPEAAQPAHRSSAGGSALPVIALRTSSAWQVLALVPEASVSRVAVGQDVTVSVPAAHIADVPGKVDEVLPTPISSSQAVVYQAVVTITGHAANVPLNGMTTDVYLGR
jgi:multidrug efflux pump subunit AcrA (membrane-fusion protein)